MELIPLIKNELSISRYDAEAENTNTKEHVTAGKGLP
jgi:hypothetical protein